MKSKWCKVVVMLLALGLARSAAADDLNQWIDGTDGNWNNAANWSLGYVPDTAAPTVDPRNNQLGGASSVATVTDTQVFGNSSGNTDFYGPEWGATLNVDGGSLTHQGFAFAPIADDAAHSTINVTNGGALNVGELLLGDNWWFSGHPYVDLNVDETSIVTARGWCWLGGTMDLQGTVDIGGSLNMDAAGMGAALINIQQGSLIVRGADLSADVANWITAGQITAYGYTPGTHGADIIVDTTTIAGGSILTAIVPEPATMALLGFGALALIRKRR